MTSLKLKSDAFSQGVSIFLIRGYQGLRPFLDRAAVSVFGYASACKHTPSCSHYMIQQIRRHGTIAGVRSGFTRILSCR